MKITAIENFAVRGLGANPWLFCAIRTDEGITGYSEYGMGSFAKGLPALDRGHRRNSDRKGPAPGR